MNKTGNTALYWVLAIIITLGTAYYQRKTGPTYPRKIYLDINGNSYSLKLPRSHGGTEDCPVELDIPDDKVSATIYYRRYPTREEWQSKPFQRMGDALKATLPNQPPAGKIAYYIELTSDGEQVKIPGEEAPILIRFKGAVPEYILYPHVLFMFLAMLLSNLTGLLSIFGIKKQVFYGRITLLLLFAGGMVLGPLVQLYAFGALWTGVPFGWDLTDNKLLISFIFWLIAILGNMKKERPWLSLLAAVVLILIYSIPHSLYGSEFNYESGEVIQGMILSVPLFLFR